MNGACKIPPWFDPSFPNCIERFKPSQYTCLPPWDEEDETVTRTLWRAGIRPTIIGKIIGRSVPAVWRKIAQMGLLGERPELATRDWQIVALRRAGLTCREIGEQFGLSGNRIGEIVRQAKAK